MSIDAPKLFPSFDPSSKYEAGSRSGESLAEVSSTVLTTIGGPTVVTSRPLPPLPKFKYLELGLLSKALSGPSPPGLPLPERAMAMIFVPFRVRSSGVGSRKVPVSWQERSRPMRIILCHARIFPDQS